MTNSIFSIVVYKHHGLWVFDDDRVGLLKEPFVAGADALIDSLSDGKEKLVIIFSDGEFSGYKLVVDQNNILAESGTYYICRERDHKLWLCPALNLYYPISPKRIFIDYK